MKHILYIKSSLFAEQSASSQLGEELIHGLLVQNPGSSVTTLDLAHHPLPHLSADEFTAWTVPDSEKTESQQRLAARSDVLVDQLLAHDTLVLAVPMYNLSVPSALKAWIDRVARAGKTFRYSAEGPVGLITGMKAYLVFARGGLYRDTPLDTQTGYLTNILALMGITDVESIYAEGLNMGDTKRVTAFRQARQSIQSLLADSIPEVRDAAA